MLVLLVALAACVRTSGDDVTVSDHADGHTAATTCSETNSQTCSDPNGAVTGPDFESAFASWCPDHTGGYRTWVAEAHRCETPDGSAFDVIEAVWYGFDEETTWYAVPSGLPIAVDRWADYNGFCCGTAFSYRRGPVPVDCMWRFDHRCE